MPTLAPPRKWRPPPLREVGPRKAIARLTNAALAQAAANARGVLESEDPEYLHQLRVGLRRLRALLRAFHVKSRRQRKELRHLALSLGEARDWDVFTSWLAAAGALAQLRAAADARRKHAREEARTTVASAAFERALNDPPVRIRRSLESDFALEAFERLRRKARKAAREIDWRDAGARHELRIRLKRLRYACDALLVLPAELRGLQDTLGELNDLAVAARLLGELGGDATLARRIAARERRLIARLPGDWRTFDRRRLPASATKA
jgi:triphosphatase